MLNIVWFRRDLRVTDHAPLLTAVEEGIAVPIYIIDTDYWGQPGTSARQWRFTARALAALRSQLAVLGAPLVVRVGSPVEVLEQLRSSSKDVSLWSHRDPRDAWNSARDDKVAEWCANHDVPWHLSDAPGFSPKPGLDKQMAEEVLPPPELMLAHGVLPGKIVSERILYLDDDDCIDVPAGPLPARQALSRFLSDAAEDYQAAHRNGWPGAETAPRLSAHLALGTISDREAWQLARDALDKSSDQAHRGIRRFIKRLAWRRRCADLASDMPTLFGDADEPDDSQAVLLQAWQTGQTGVPIIDACMRCLGQTGWLPERLRTQVVRFGIGHLGLPPSVLGPALARLCTDFDPVLFQPNFLTAAGVCNGVASADPIALSKAADPECNFIRAHIPELGGVETDDIHLPADPPAGYPAPITGAERQVLPEAVLDNDLKAKLSARVRAVKPAAPPRNKSFG